MKRTLTAAIIGIGYIGKAHLAALLPKVERVVICDPNVETSEAFAKQNGCDFYADYKQMLEHETPDFACVCVPTHLHADITVDLLRHGVDVLCEKPFATTEEDARRMIETAAATDRLLMVGHCVRFAPSYVYLKNCLDDGRFGKLRYIKLYRHGEPPTWSVGDWLRDTEKSGGAVMDLHIHDTDFIRSLLGVPHSVTSVGSRSACTTVYAYDEDVSVASEVSWRQVRGFGFVAGYDAAFENAVVQCQGDCLTVCLDGQIGNPIAEETFASYIESEDIYANEIEYFIQCLEQGARPTFCPPEESLDSLAITLAEIRSLGSKQNERV